MVPSKKTPWVSFFFLKRIDAMVKFTESSNEILDQIIKEERRKNKNVR